MHIAISYATLLYEYLGRCGWDAQALLGPPPSSADGRLPMQHWQELLQRADALLGEPALGLRIAEGINPRHFGVAGYAALACSTLGEALQRLERYHVLIYDANPGQMCCNGTQMIVEWGISKGLPGQLADETGVAALLQLARNMTGAHLAATSVSFVNPPPDDPSPYLAFFGGPVNFAQPCTRLIMPADYLALPLRQADPALLALLDTQAESFLCQLQRGGPLEKYQQALIPLLRTGQASLQTLAAHLHRSPRTLQRHLAEQHTSFQQLLDDTRHQLAKGYLRTPGMTLGEIAILLGYSEQSAFSRAFRQWSGDSPLTWRKRLRSTDR